MVRGTKIYALVRDLVLEGGHAKCSPRVDLCWGSMTSSVAPETVYWTISAISDSVCVGRCNKHQTAPGHHTECNLDQGQRAK